MKPHVMILIAHLLLLQTACFGSEMLVTLDEKIRCSELVAVGTVTEVELKTIRTMPDSSRRAQDTIIRFRLDECILGDKKGEILIETHSVYYREGSTRHDASAGFSNYRVTKGKRFIGYLKKVDDRFILSGESNQFLEDIDDLTKTIRDVGQTSNWVPLEWKMNELRKLVLQTDWTKKAQPAGAGQPVAKPSDKPTVKDQPPLEKRVADQEMIVKKKQDVLSNIARTKGIVYNGQSMEPSNTSDAAKSGLVDEDFMTAMREYKAEMAILQSMKIQLIREQLEEKSGMR